MGSEGFVVCDKDLDFGERFSSGLSLPPSPVGSNATVQTLVTINFILIIPRVASILSRFFFQLLASVQSANSHWI